MYTRLLLLNILFIISVQSVNADIIKEALYQDNIGNEVKAIELLSKEVKTNKTNAEALYYLANYFQYESYYRKNDLNVHKLYVKIAELLKKKEVLSVNERLVLAEMYEDGKGVQKNKKKAFDIYRVLSKDGNAEAQKKLYRYYKYGRVVPKDNNEAEKWFKLSYESFKKRALEGDLDAYIEVAEFHRYINQPFKLDKGEVLKWLQKAASQKYIPAMLSLASFYNRSSIVGGEKKKGIFYERKAIELGSPRAKHDLGVNYLYGIGVPIDYIKSKKLISEAYVEGYKYGLNKYITVLALNNNSNDDKEISKLININCFIEGQYKPNLYCTDIEPYIIGYIFKNGIGVESNFKEAIKFYSYGASGLGKFSNGFSNYQLGNIYKEGDGVLKDYNKAIEYYKKSIEHNYKKAYCSIVEPLFELNKVDEAKVFAKKGFELEVKECKLIWEKLKLYKY